IQGLADEVAAIFVPVVLAVSAITFGVWMWLGPEPKLAHAIVNAVAVLIIACPCALGLATPMSIMVGVGRGAQLGVLVKNAEALERLEKVTTLVVDKTGTLTEGKPDFLRQEKITGLESLEASATKLQEDGKTAMFVAVDGKPVGILAVADPIKSTTAEATQELHALGLKLVMLTGDNRRTAAAVAKQLGLDTVEADMDPTGKVAYVKKLRTEGKRVAMAGDGINDAPALSEAEVGI